jgi:hypothetical protein
MKQIYKRQDLIKAGIGSFGISVCFETQGRKDSSSRRKNANENMSDDLFFKISLAIKNLKNKVEYIINNKNVKFDFLFA